MSALREAVEDFLAQQRIAVVGFSRKKDQPANLILKKLRQGGREVFAVNPVATEIHGERCYPSLEAIPGGVGAVMIATHPEITPRIVEECVNLGIRRVWMHRSFGRGSVAEQAVRRGREAGLTVIDGACPMMFCKPVDPAHLCMRWILRLAGKLPGPT